MREPNRREIRFQGSLERLPNARFVASVTYDEFDPTVLEISLLWLGDEEEHRAAAQALRVPRHELILLPDDAAEPAVEVLGISGISTGGNEATVRAGAIRVGFTRHKAVNERKYVFKAELQPSGILSVPMFRNLIYTGEIKHEPMITGTVQIQTPFGPLEAGEHFRYFDTVEGGNKITHSVHRAGITGEISLRSSKSLAELHDEVSGELEKIALCLSLCYRQPVGYYEVRYMQLPRTDAKEQLYESFECTRWTSARGKLKEDELINIRSLVSGGLERLVSALRNDPDRESLERAIRFLTASYTTPLEPAYFMAFSAMEATVDACIPEDDRYIARGSEWKNIERTLRQALDGMELGAVADRLKAKLGELRRATFLSRVERACERLSAHTGDIWPSLDFSTGISSAARMRNDLFHSARLHDDLSEMSRNIVRIRTLTERLLLKKLDWPDDQIWRWYDQNLKWVNA